MADNMNLTKVVYDLKDSIKDFKKESELNLDEKINEVYNSINDVSNSISDVINEKTILDNVSTTSNVKIYDNSPTILESDKVMDGVFMKSYQPFLSEVGRKNITISFEPSLLMLSGGVNGYGNNKSNITDMFKGCTNLKTVYIKAKSGNMTSIKHSQVGEWIKQVCKDSGLQEPSVIDLGV